MVEKRSLGRAGGPADHLVTVGVIGSRLDHGGAAHGVAPFVSGFARDDLRRRVAVGRTQEYLAAPVEEIGDRELERRADRLDGASCMAVHQHAIQFELETQRRLLVIVRGTARHGAILGILACLR